MPYYINSIYNIMQLYGELKEIEIYKNALVQKNEDIKKIKKKMDSMYLHFKKIIEDGRTIDKTIENAISKGENTIIVYQDSRLTIEQNRELFETFYQIDTEYCQLNDNGIPLISLLENRYKKPFTVYSEALSVPKLDDPYENEDLYTIYIKWKKINKKSSCVIC